MPLPLFPFLLLGGAVLAGIAASGSSSSGGGSSGPPLPPNGIPPTPSGAGGDLVSALVPPPGFPTSALANYEPPSQGMQLYTIVLPGFLASMATVPSPVREIVADQLCMGQTSNPQNVVPGLTALAAWMDAQGYAVNGVPAANLIRSRIAELQIGGLEKVQPFGPPVTIDPQAPASTRARFFEAALTANSARLMQLGVIAAQFAWPQLAATCAAWLQYLGAGTAPAMARLPPVPVPPLPGTLPPQWQPPLSRPAPPGWQPPPQSTPGPNPNGRPPGGSALPPLPGGFNPPGGLPGGFPIPPGFPGPFPGTLPGGLPLPPGIPGGLGALPPGSIPGSWPGGLPGTLPGGGPPNGPPPNGPPPGAVLPVGAYIAPDSALHYVMQPGDYGAKIVAKFKKLKANSGLWIKQMIHCNPDVPWSNPSTIYPGTDITLPVSWADPRVQVPKSDDLSAEPRLRRDGALKAPAPLAPRGPKGKKRAPKVLTSGEDSPPETRDEYVVQKGDDLRSILEKLGQNMLTARQLGKCNPRINLAALTPGMTLQLPAAWDRRKTA